MSSLGLAIVLYWSANAGAFLWALAGASDTAKRELRASIVRLGPGTTRRTVKLMAMSMVVVVGFLPMALLEAVRQPRS